MKNKRCLLQNSEGKRYTCVISTEKDKIYEFDCYVTETIPDYRLVAEYGDMKAKYYLAMDGYEVVTKLLMVDEGNTPEEITFDKILIWVVAICAGFLGFSTVFGTSNGDVMLMVLAAEFVAIATIVVGVLRRRHINHRK